MKCSKLQQKSFWVLVTALPAPFCQTLTVAGTFCSKIFFELVENSGRGFSSIPARACSLLKTKRTVKRRQLKSSQSSTPTCSTLRMTVCLTIWPLKQSGCLTNQKCSLRHLFEWLKVNHFWTPELQPSWWRQSGKGIFSRILV